MISAQYRRFGANEHESWVLQSSFHFLFATFRIPGIKYAFDPDYHEAVKPE
jgi:hypothetical protein